MRQPAQAALAWVNKTQQRNYELTGVVDYEQALTAKPGDFFELGLILCDGEICAREQVRVQPQSDAEQDRYVFNLVDAAVRDIPPLLDPPQGIRREWLAGELKKHEFVLLLFYRGLW